MRDKEDDKGDDKGMRDKEDDEEECTSANRMNSQRYS